MVNQGDIEKRLDVHYNIPYHKVLFQKLKALNGRTISELSERIFSGITPLSGSDAYIEQRDGGIPFYRSGEITSEGSVPQTPKLFIDSEIHHKKMKSSQLKKNDVLIAIVGATIGSVGIYPFDNEANINQAIAGVRLKKDAFVNPYYLSAYLKSEIGQSVLNAISRPVARANINLEEVGQIIVPLPPMDVQAHIVDLMQDAHATIQSKEAEATALRQSIDGYVLEQLGITLPTVEKRLCFGVSSSQVQGSRLDGEYYRHASNTTNADKITHCLGDFITAINYGASVKNSYNDEGIPFLRILNILPNEIDISKVVRLSQDTKLSESSFVKEGDFLISRSGTIGIVAMVPKQADGYAFGSFMIKFSIDSSVLNKQFLSTWLNCSMIQSWLNKSKIGAIQGNITIPTIKNIPLALPPRPLQDAIAEEVQARLARAKQLEGEAKLALASAKANVERLLFGEPSPSP